MYHSNDSFVSLEEMRVQFRHFSRLVLKTIDNRDYHMQRIRIANGLQSNEAVQGALTDFFYGCWFDVVYDDGRIMDILDEVRPRLNSHVYHSLKKCINRQAWSIEHISEFATGWSVLVTPSMDVALHRLRTSIDNTRSVVDQFIGQLLSAHKQNDNEAVAEIEQEFFDHCLVCDDSMAFMKVWFKLNKQNWNFDERWQDCQRRLEAIQH